MPVPNEHMIIEKDTLLKDSRTSSQAIFGKFVKNDHSQAVVLRANDTIELYNIINDKMHLLTKYECTTCKISKIIAIRKPGTQKDMLVLHIPKLKFVTIEIDESKLEFKIVCLHNFDNDARLRKTFKMNPRQGFLQPFYL